MTSESVDDLSYKLYGITRYAKSMENCSNSGNITIENTEKNDPEYGPALTACGVVEKCSKKRLFIRMCGIENRLKAA